MSLLCWNDISTPTPTPHPSLSPNSRVGTVSFQITCPSPGLLTPSQSQGGLVRLDYFLSKASKLAAPILILFGDGTVGTDSVQERMVSEPLLFFAFSCKGQHFQTESLCSLCTLIIFISLPLWTIGQAGTGATRVDGGKAESYNSRPDGNASFPPAHSFIYSFNEYQSSDLEESSFPHRSGGVSSIHPFIHSFK